ncbi:hypothetical protein [Microbacterium sp.]|jgi:hypothetical protein|uniref:hypothetical protein n=1 Tax=Microbacterium sp. TaxID=51671 RepID=UPI002CA9CD29|nr:hypothetical protein [Microbacterium sp.]HWL78453.1 hypothetical protein [Microbacterium sp.]
MEHENTDDRAAEMRGDKRPLDPEQAQDTPMLAQNEASEVDKVAGIVVQTRSDVGDKSIDEIAHVLRQRLNDSSIELPDSEVQELAKQIATGTS